MTATIHSIRQAHQVREIFEPISERLEQVELFFTRELAQALPMIRDVAGYVLGGGGKRLRPAVVLLTSRMLGYRGERDIRYGAVVELIHTATLIHDDIIDRSDLRRGKPTANHTWGTQTSVLVGDWLYARAMELCLELGDLEVMRRLTWATVQMSEGEVLADQVRGRLEVDEELYLDITRRKTAELFAAASALPALFQPSTLHLTEPLLDFGRDLGMCFQLIDDVLDFASSRAELGKPVMADLREGRITLPMIHLLPRLSHRQREQVRAVLRDGVFEAISERELLEMVRTSGALEATRERAATYAASAIAGADRFPPGPERDALIKATNLLLERRR